MSTPDESDYALVHTELVALVESARTVAARRVNALMSAVYWEIGRRIVETEQGGKNRPTYGEGLIERLAMDLGVRFGRGFSATNLRQMRAFHLAWPPEYIQQTVSADSFGRHNDQTSRVSALAEAFPLPWSSYVRLLRVSSDVARAFYEREAIHGGCRSVSSDVRLTASSTSELPCPATRRRR